MALDMANSDSSSSTVRVLVSFYLVVTENTCSIRTSAIHQENSMFPMKFYVWRWTQRPLQLCKDFKPFTVLAEIAKNKGLRDHYCQSPKGRQWHQDVFTQNSRCLEIWVWHCYQGKQSACIQHDRSRCHIMLFPHTEVQKAIPFFAEALKHTWIWNINRKGQPSSYIN